MPKVFFSMGIEGNNFDIRVSPSVGGTRNKPLRAESKFGRFWGKGRAVLWLAGMPKVFLSILIEENNFGIGKGLAVVMRAKVCQKCFSTKTEENNFDKLWC